MSHPSLLRRLALSGALAAVLFASFLLIRAVAAFAATGLDVPDHARFERFLDKSDHRAEFTAFEAHLRKEGVAGVVPAWTLWRQGTDWRGLDEPAFAVPPRSQWSGIVPTLKLLREHVLPAVGPVEVVSGFRTERYNARAGGATGSRHKWFEALDVVPERAWPRAELHETLLGVWRRRGPQTGFGLGLYGRTRFHVDTHRHRRW